MGQISAPNAYRRPAPPRIFLAAVFRLNQVNAVNALGNRIRELRHQRGLTLQALGQKAGVTASHLSEIELGRRNPSPQLLSKLAAPLGTTLPRLSESDTRVALKQIKHLMDETPEIAATLVQLAKDAADSHRRILRRAKRVSRIP